MDGQIVHGRAAYLGPEAPAKRGPAEEKSMRGEGVRRWARAAARSAAVLTRRPWCDGPVGAEEVPAPSIVAAARDLK
jgi:hypothetical protein